MPPPHWVGHQSTGMGWAGRRWQRRPWAESTATQGLPVSPRRNGRHRPQGPREDGWSYRATDDRSRNEARCHRVGPSIRRVGGIPNPFLLVRRQAARGQWMLRPSWLRGPWPPLPDVEPGGPGTPGGREEGRRTETADRKATKKPQADEGRPKWRGSGDSERDSLPPTSPQIGDLGGKNKSSSRAPRNRWSGTEAGPAIYQQRGGGPPSALLVQVHC